MLEQELDWQAEWKPAHMGLLEANAPETEEKSTKALRDPEPQKAMRSPQRDEAAKRAPGVRRLYPAIRKTAASFPPPRVNTGEEHVLFV